MSLKLLNRSIKFLGTFITLLLIHGSCKKEEYPVEKNQLTGDTAIFVGTWNWAYSEHSYGWCDNEQWFEILTPASIGSEYKINFDKIGIITLFKDNNLLWEHRVEMIQFIDGEDYCLLTNAIKFGIDLSKKDEFNFNGCINEDTIRLGSVPGFLFQSEPGCENYKNYFIKE